MTIRIAAIACGLAATISVRALAAFPPVPATTPPPTAPTDLTRGDLETRFGAPFALGWAQYLPTGPGLNLYPPATEFVICFRPYTGPTSPPCSRASHDWHEPIAGSSPALTRTGNFFRFAPGNAIALADLDKPFRFTVGACSAPNEASCRYSAADVFYSTRNLVAEPAQTALASTPLNWKIDVRASNPGDSGVGKFKGIVELFEVLGFGAPGRDCIKDFDAAGLSADPTLVVLDKRGGRTPITMVSRDTNHVYNGPEVAGVYRLGDFNTSQSFTTAAPSIGAHVVDRGVYLADFAIPSNVMPRTFVIITTLDTDSAAREYNEDDNSRGKCRTR